LGPVEEDPDKEIVAELLEAVDDAGFDEQHVGRGDRMAMRAVDEPAGTTRDDVRLVTRVRLLRIDAARRVELHLQRSVLEDRGRALALRRRKHGFRFGERYPVALVR